MADITFTNSIRITRLNVMRRRLKRRLDAMERERAYHAMLALAATQSNDQQPGDPTDTCPCEPCQQRRALGISLSAVLRSIGVSADDDAAPDPCAVSKQH